MGESAPVLTGGNPNNDKGGNKPYNITLWTSTAKKDSNGFYTSDWYDHVLQNNVPGDKRKIGFLYKVKPNTRVLQLELDSDVRSIYKIFQDLGRDNQILNDKEAWKREIDLMYSGHGNIEINLMKRDFPWKEIAKHFDCIHHDAWISRRDYNAFLFGYDTESTAWFNPNNLEFLGQVPLIDQIPEKDDY